VTDGGTDAARPPLALVKGAGDLATGVALRLRRSGFAVAMTELQRPTVVRRTVAFAEAMYEARTTVEGVDGVRVDDVADVPRLLAEGVVPVLLDPEACSVAVLRPALLVDAIMAKRNVGTTIGDAPVVVALGPGFVAGRDAHAVVETKRGHTLGRVIAEGAAIPDTGVPGEIGGVGEERLVRSPTAGVFEARRRIGDRVVAGETVGRVGEVPVKARTDGLLRGLLRSGLEVREGMKLGDVDPRGVPEHCALVSDKALAVAGGVLEAACALLGLIAPAQGSSPIVAAGEGRGAPSTETTGGPRPQGG
jgi:xanthine dehydrogenase accessory factor